METDISVVILVGGFGTRIKHLLENLPKPMAPVAGRPFIEWVVRYFFGQGVRRFVLSTGYLAEVIAQHFSSQPVPGIKVVCVPETEPLGTAGGFLHAVAGSGFDSRHWLVANGDSLAFADLAGLLAAVQPESVSAAILGLAVPDTSRYGTLDVSPTSQLVRFAEKRPGSGLINAGVYAFKAQALLAFPTTRPLSFETDVFPSFLAAGKQLAVHPVRVPFLDIGTPDTLTKAGEFIQANLGCFPKNPSPLQP